MDEEYQIINSILTKLNATRLHPQKTLGVTTLQPIGYLMFFMKMHQEYKCFPIEYVQSLDIPAVTGQDIVNRIRGIS